MNREDSRHNHPVFLGRRLNPRAVQEAGRVVWLVDSGLADFLIPQALAIDMERPGFQPKVTVATTLACTEPLLRRVLGNLQGKPDIAGVVADADRVALMGFFLAATAARNAVLGADIGAAQFLMTARGDGAGDADVAARLVSRFFGLGSFQDRFDRMQHLRAPFKKLFTFVERHFRQEEVAERVCKIAVRTAAIGSISWLDVRSLGHTPVDFGEFDWR